MKMPLIFVLFCISVSSSRTVLVVSGHVGEDLSIQFLSNRTSNNSSEQFFYKAQCSKENLLIQTESTGSTLRQQERYSTERNGTIFKVTIKRLKRTDAGMYCCKLGTNGTVWSQDIQVTVLDAATVPFTTSPETTDFTVSQESLSSSTVKPASVSLSQTPEGSNKEAATNLTDTTVVIIVSVSLALLVCAIIPLIFYGHWRSTAENQNPAEAHKAGTDYCEENTDIPSTQTALTLQTLDKEAEDAQDASQYAAIYQALDPQTLDQV